MAANVADSGNGLRSTGGANALLQDEAIVGVQPQTSKASSTLLLAVAICCVSPILFGLSLGFTSPSQSTLVGDLNDEPADLNVIPENVMSWYAAIINIGAVIGAFAGSALSDRVGRRKTLALTAVPHFVAWFGSSFAQDWKLMCLLRFIIGCAVGIGSAVTPVYISEVATVDLRGSLGCANQLSVTIGIFLANLVGSFVFIDDQVCQWRHMCFFIAILSLPLVVMLVMPESPKWLASKGMANATRQSLKRLRANDASQEAEEMLASSSSGPAATEHQQTMITPSLADYKKSMLIGIGLCVFQQFSGINAVIFFTGSICEQAGVPNPSASAMVSMGAQVLLTGLACVLIERAGRRGLLLFASSTMAIALFILSYYFLAQDLGLWGPSWMALIGLGLFIMGFSLGLGPIPWLIIGEIFPTEVRSSASSCATAANWSSSFIVTLAFSHMEALLTKEGTFAFFGTVCVTCFVFVYAVVPETRGKSIDDVLLALNGGRGTQARDLSLERAEPPKA